MCNKTPPKPVKKLKRYRPQRNTFSVISCSSFNVEKLFGSDKTAAIAASILIFFLLVITQSTHGAIERAQAHTQHHAKTATTQPKHSWSQRAGGPLKRQHRQNSCLLCGGIRATSDCVSTNAQQIPRIRQTLAGRRGRSKCWSIPVCYVHLLEQPENINHGLSLQGASRCSLTSRKCCVLLGESALPGSWRNRRPFFYISHADSKIGDRL